ncbi:hypothetical protein [Halorientalis litorea]|uniref:hypothetical protein n=1 Tax=Halorientalis litorea TaxID=2931977 RepID=UPI001FF6D1AA|nr:hypothetical protein [Halorientalis litorea]
MPDDATPFEDGAVTLGHVGLGGAAVSFVGMAVTAQVLFATLTVTALVGITAGGGMYFLLPYVMRRAAAEADGHAVDARQQQAGAVGAALSAGSLFVLTGMFVFEQPIPSAVFALATALVAYVVARLTMPAGPE